MSNSADSLKKKVCVTVFLDELFEEVHSEESGNAEPLNVNSDLKFKISEKDSEEKSQLELGNHESPTTFSNPEVRLKVDEPRPRKHRRESKFSKNPYKLLKTLKKYGPALESKKERKNCELLDSPISDSDLDDHFDLNNKEKTSKAIRESVTDLNDFDGKGGSDLSGVICGTSVKDQPTKNLDDKYSNDVISFCSKSTQVENNENKEALTENAKIEKQEQKRIVENLAWRKTQKHLQLILENAKNWCEMNDENRIKSYDLRSISEECEKTDDHINVIKGRAGSGTEDWSTDFYESDTRELSDSYTCIFPHNRRRVALKPRRMKRVFAKKFWNSEFESDVSELEDASYQEDLRKLENPYKDCKSVLCYTSCGNGKKSGLITSEIQENKENVQCQKKSETISLESYISGLKTKTVDGQDDHLPHTCTLLSVEKDKESMQEKLQKTKGESDFKNLVNHHGGNLTPDDEKGKKFKEKSENLLPLQSNEKLLICEEILNRVGGKTENQKRAVINSKEIEFLASPKREKDYHQGTVKGIAEVFIKRKANENKEKCVSETESETIFAESVNSLDCKDFEDFRNLESISKASLYESHLEKDDYSSLEFNDEVSLSKLLKKIRTVEIVTEGSANETNNSSAEVILICGNTSNEDASINAWQSKVSITKSLTEVGQCYLKDSKNSSMYLIEIPFQFRRKKRQRILE